MTGIGVGEIIAILLSLAGFGVAPNPAAPPAAEIVRYAPDDAELLFYLDVQAVGPPNWQALEKLPAAPAVKASKAATRAVGKLVAELKKARADAKAASGLDPVSDVQTATAFVTFHGSAEPDLLVILRGKFPANAVDRVAEKLGGTRSVVGGRPLITSPDGKYAFALAGDGALLGGTTLWVQERAGAYTPKRAPLADVAAPLLDRKPFFFAAMRLSPGTLLVASRGVDDPLATDVFGSLEDLELGLYADGVGVSFKSRTPSGYARGLLAVDGAVELLRAGHHYLRGFARLGAAVVDSYVKKSPELAPIVAHKADLLRLFDASTGDGTFQVATEKKEAERRVNVRLSGRSIGEVLPAAGLIVPLGLGVYLAEAANQP